MTGLLLLLGLARADGPTGYPFALEAGVCGGAGLSSPYASGGVSGLGCVAARALLQGRRFAGELSFREGWAGADARSVGGLYLGARARLGERLFARGGFSHHHEVPAALVEEQPLGAALGSAVGIRHRSGLELGVGALLPVEERMLGDRLGVSLSLSASAFPDRLGPVVYTFADLTAVVGVGRARGG